MREQSRLLPEPIGSTRVVVVADIRLYREGLAANLAGRSNLTVLGKAGTADETLEIQATLRADVVVIDIGMHDSLGLVRAVKRLDANVRIVAFGLDESEPDVLACAEAGVAGYVARDGSIEDLVATIGRCCRGELICSPRIAATLFDRLSCLANGRQDSATASLTERQRQIVLLIDAGLSNKEIALRLHIEVPTVKNHVHNILEKLQVTTRAAAAARLRVRGGRRSALVPTDPLPSQP